MDKIEKVKIHVPEWSPCTIQRIIGDQTVTLYEKIPYQEKIDMAEELIAWTCVLDEELGIAYDAPNRHMISRFLMLKYYTNIDTSELETDDEIHDLLDAVPQVVMGEILDFVDLDYREFLLLYDGMHKAVEKMFEREHSLGHLISKGFGDILKSEDPAGTMRSAKALNESLIDMMGDAANYQKDKQGKPSVMAGKNVINFAKKKG